MKRLIVVMFVLLNIHCFAFENGLDWLDHYVLAEKAIAIKDGKKALEEFSTAIKLNPNELILYVQRGQVYVKRHEYAKAVEDFTYVIESPNSHASVLLPALRGRAGCYLVLDGDVCFPKDMSRTDRFHLDYDRAKALDPYIDYTKENKRYEITANIPESDLHNQDFKNAFTAVRIQLGMCDSENDITFFDNGVAVTLLKKNCLCKERKNVEKKNLQQDIHYCVGCGTLLKDLMGHNKNPTQETDCKWWCNRVGETADSVCVATFKSSSCRYLCAKIVKATIKACVSCCADGGFYKNCVEPFEDFLTRVGCEDPIW